MEVSRKQPAEAMQDQFGEQVAEVRMQDILNQFEVSDNTIQTSLNQIGHDISDIKEKIVKKKSKATLADINSKLDLILQYLGVQK